MLHINKINNHETKYLRHRSLRAVIAVFRLNSLPVTPVYCSFVPEYDVTKGDT